MRSIDQRIDHLKNQILDGLNQKGILNELQSQFLSDVAQFIQTTEYDVFKPHRERRHTQMYEIAEFVVVQYLKNKKMLHTLQSFLSESKIDEKEIDLESEKSTEIINKINLERRNLWIHQILNDWNTNKEIFINRSKKYTRKLIKDRLNKIDGEANNINNDNSTKILNSPSSKGQNEAVSKNDDFVEEEEKDESESDSQKKRNGKPIWYDEIPSQDPTGTSEFVSGDEEPPSMFQKKETANSKNIFSDISPINSISNQGAKKKLNTNIFLNLDDANKSNETEKSANDKSINHELNDLKDKNISNQSKNIPPNKKDTQTIESKENISTKQQNKESLSTNQQNKENLSANQQNKENLSANQQNKENLSSKQQNKENLSSNQQNKENLSTKQQNKEHSIDVDDENMFSDENEAPQKKKETLLSDSNEPEVTQKKTNISTVNNDSDEFYDFDSDDNSSSIKNQNVKKENTQTDNNKKNANKVVSSESDIDFELSDSDPQQNSAKKKPNQPPIKNNDHSDSFDFSSGSFGNEKTETPAKKQNPKKENDDSFFDYDFNDDSNDDQKSKPKKIENKNKKTEDESNFDDFDDFDD